jgi:hypothetical protein
MKFPHKIGMAMNYQSVNARFYAQTHNISGLAAEFRRLLHGRPTAIMVKLMNFRVAGCA